MRKNSLNEIYYFKIISQFISSWNSGEFYKEIYVVVILTPIH